METFGAGAQFVYSMRAFCYVGITTDRTDSAELTVLNHD